MDKKDKKGQECTPVHNPIPITTPQKQTSGDKQFDEAIDRMLKKPLHQIPIK